MIYEIYVKNIVNMKELDEAYILLIKNALNNNIK